MSNLKVLTKWQSRLTAAITDSATTAYVQECATAPTAPFKALLDNGQETEEVIMVTAVDTVTKALTIVRAKQGSTAVAHKANGLVHHCELTAGEVPPLIISKADDASLTALEAGIILVSVDNKTMTLPAVAGNAGLKFIIKTTCAISTGVTVDGNGAETIDGQATVVLLDQYEVLRIVCDGTKWHII